MHSSIEEVMPFLDTQIYALETDTYAILNRGVHASRVPFVSALLSMLQDCLSPSTENPADLENMFCGARRVAFPFASQLQSFSSRMVYVQRLFPSCLDCKALRVGCIPSSRES